MGHKRKEENKHQQNHWQGYLFYNGNPSAKQSAFKMNQHMKIYTQKEIQDHLSSRLKGWTYADGVIRRNLEFGNFTEAFSFMTAVALEAEKMDHHPEWSNVYNKVSIGLNTHSAGGITQLDIDLAEKIDQAFAKL